MSRHSVKRSAAGRGRVNQDRALDRTDLSRLQHEALRGAKARAEEGAGRGAQRGKRAVGSVVKVDDGIRDPPEVLTEDKKLFDNQSEIDFRRADSWRVLRIFSEFVEGIDALGDVDKAVAIFGSARTTRDDPYYEAARRTAELLAQAGYAIITGGGPGIMEAGNRGARDGGGRSIGCNIELPFEQRPIRISIRSSSFATSSCARRCSSSTRPRSSSFRAGSERSTSSSRRSRSSRPARSPTSP
ncbi:MAG TPA: hypothetical protein VIV58_05625, partial [Kofleriaceae bacterium]